LVALSPGMGLFPSDWMRWFYTAPAQRFRG